MSRPVDPRLLRVVPATRRLIVVLVGLDGLAAVLTVVQALALARTIVTIAQGANSDLGTGLGLLVAAAVGRAALGAIQEWVTARSSVRIRADLRARTLHAVVTLGPSWARRQPAGRLVNTTGPGLDALDAWVTRALPAVVAAGVVPPVVLLAVAAVDWPSAVILLVLLPLVPVFMILIGVTTRRRVQRQYAILGRLAGQFLDLLRGLTTLRVYGRAEAQERTLQRVTENYRVQTMSALRLALVSGLVLDLLATLSLAVVAVGVGLRLDSAHVSFATALAVLILAPEVFVPLRAVGAAHHAAQEGATAAAGALDVVDEAAAADPVPRSDAEPVPLGDGHIRLADAGVQYPGRPAFALRGVRASLRPGRIVALTGRSGAGKSTLLALLRGEVQASSGEVLIGARGATLAGLPVEGWRRDVAWLPQRPVPTQATVADEVRLGDQGATDADLARACLDCAAPDPATSLGEDGRLVSAGQRRRIALARVLLRARAVVARGGVPIVLLDEPSEDLDRATEAVVTAVVRDLGGWATVVIATHSERLAAVADEIWRLDSGRLVAVRDARREHPPVAPPSAPPVTPPRTGTTLAEPTPVHRTDRVTAPARLRLRELSREIGATRRLALAAALSGGAAVSGVALTATSMWLIARAAQHPNVQALAIAVVGVRTFALLRPLLRYAERLATHDGALVLLTGLRLRIFSALRRRPAPPEHGRGDLLRRFVGDVDGVQDGLVRAAVPAAGALAGGIAAVALALALDPSAGAVLALGLLLAGFVLPVLTLRLAGAADVPAAAAGRRDRRGAALLDGLDELVAYGAGAGAVDRIADQDRMVERATRRPAAVAALGTLGGGVAAAVTLAAMLVAAQAARGAGRISPVEVGVLAACALAGFELTAGLPAAFAAWARCRAGLRRVAAIVGDAPASVELGTVLPPTRRTGLVARGLTLAPGPIAPLVLAGVDLDVHAGDRVAVVGPSGSGKSTLLAAVLGQLHAEAGSLTLTGPEGDLDLASVPDTGVAASIAGSLQGDHVFDSTLRDNLRVVRPEADDRELDRVAERVGLLELVRTLPQGWSTPAGPDGSGLSGGQRQRLLIARALLADPAILVLDEPSAHLDADTERSLLDDLLTATAGRTVLLSTHRELTDGRVDRTLGIEDRLLVGR